MLATAIHEPLASTRQDTNYSLVSSGSLLKADSGALVLSYWILSNSCLSSAGQMLRMTCSKSVTPTQGLVPSILQRLTTLRKE